MNPTIVTPPATEPLTLAEAKAHLKIDHTDEDSYITDLIAAARKFCEIYAKLAVIDQTLKWTLNAWPGYGGECLESHPLISGYQKNRSAELPIGPVLSVTSVTTYDDSDNATVWDASNYYVSTAHNRVYRRTGVTWPIPGRAADGIEIIYRAGFGANASDVPVALRQALLQLVAHLYVNREAASDTAALNVPFTVREQFNLFRRIGL